MAPYLLCDRDDELHIHVAVQVARNFHLVQLQLHEGLHHVRRGHRLPLLVLAHVVRARRQVDDEDLKNSILSIKRQIFLIQNLVNEFSTYARLPQANIIRLNLSDISLIYIEEYIKNYPNINFISNIEKNIIVDFDQSYLDIILNNLFNR